MKYLIKSLLILTLYFTSSYAITLNIDLVDGESSNVSVTQLQDRTVNLVTSAGATVVPVIGENNILDAQTASDDGTVSFTITTDILEQYNKTNVEIDFVASLDSFQSSTTVIFNINIDEIHLQTNNSYLQFDGESTSSLSIPSLDKTGSFTIDFWINRYDTNCTETTIFQNTNLRVYYFNDTTTETCNIQVSVNGTNIFGGYEVPIDLEYDTWNNITLKFVEIDGFSNILYLYENGNYRNEATNEVLDDTNYPLLSGIITIGASAKISIDEIKIFDILVDDFKQKVIGNRQVLSSEYTNLLRYYNFEEGFGTKVKDFKNEYDATINGTAQRINFESATTDFSSLLNSIKVASSEMVLPLELKTFNEDQMSIGAWINLKEHTLIEQSTFQIFGDSTNYSFYLEQILGNDDGHNYRMAFLIKTAEGTQTHTYDVTLDYSRWYYLTATYDNSTFNFYINGNNVSSFTTENISFLGVLSSETQQDFTQWYYIGSQFNHHNVGLKDKLSQVSLWKKALSSQEINKIMHNYVNFNDSNLIGYWSLNEENNGSNLSSNGTTLDFSTTSQTIDGVSFWKNETIPTIKGTKLYVSDSKTEYSKIFKDTTIEDNLTYATQGLNASLENSKYLKYTPSTLQANSSDTVTINTNETDPQTAQILFTKNIDIDINTYDEKLILNFNNYNSSDKTITVVDVISSYDESSVHDIKGFQDGTTTSATGDLGYYLDSSFRLKFDAKNDIGQDKTWYYNFSTKKIESGTPSDFTNYQITLPQNQNVLDIDLSLSNWVYTSIQVPELKDYSLSQKEDNTTLNIDLNTYVLSKVGDSAITSWSIVEDVSNLFEISSDGKLTFQTGKSFDYETLTSHIVKVKATNDAGDSEEATITFTIMDVADVKPTLAANGSFTVPENAGFSYPLSQISTFLISEGDSPITKWTVSNDASGKFTISSDGLLSSKTGPLDYETATSYNFDIVATNGAGDSNTSNFTIIINDEQEVVEFSLSMQNTSFSIYENSDFSTENEAITIVAFQQQPIGTITYSISGDDASLFSVDSSSGVISMNAKDYENALDSNGDNVYNVTLIATDSDENSASLDLDISVTDIKETTSFTINNFEVTSTPENSPFTSSDASINGSHIGVLSYSLTGVDASLFSINVLTGAISLNAKDFESPSDSNGDNVYNVTLIIKDSDENSASLDLDISVTDIKETALFIINSFEVTSTPENSAFTSSDASINGNYIGNLTYSLSGVDSSLFSVNALTGAISLSAKDYENALDSNGDNVYNITLIAKDSDENSASLDLDINVTNVEETANIVLNTLDNVIIDENTDFTSVKPSLKENSDEPIGTLNYSLSGNDSKYFEIDSSTGVVTMIAKDFENALDSNLDNTYNIAITAKDEENNSSTIEFNVTIKDVIEKVDFIITNLKSSSIEENSSYTSISPEFSDEPIGEMTYSLDGVDKDLFSVNVKTGVITLSAKDYENPSDNDKNNEYEVTLIAIDSDENSTSTNLTIVVSNVAETVPTFDDTVISLDENTQTKELIGTITNFNKGDSQISTFIVTGDDSNKFYIAVENEKANIYINENSTFDYENITTYNLNVEAINDSGKSAKKSLTVNINDIPDITVSLSDTTVNGISETISSNTSLNEKIIINNLESIDSEITSFILTGDGSENFIIENDGTIKTSESSKFNIDDKKTYSLNVIAINSAGESNSALLTINIDKNNTPTLVELYDRYITLNSSKTLGLSVDDLDNNDLSLQVSVDSNDIIEVTSNLSQISKDNYTNLSLTISSLGKLGVATVTITIDDKFDSITKEFDVIIENDNRFKHNQTIVNKEYYDNASETISLNINDKFYMLENNRGQNIDSSNSKIYYSSYKVIDTNKILVTKYFDKNSEVTILEEETNYYKVENNEVFIYSDEAKEIQISQFKLKSLGKQETKNILTQINTNYSIQDTHNAYELIKKESSSKLEILDEIIYKNETFNSLDEFMKTFSTSNKLGLIRSYDRSKFLVLNDEELSSTSGSLIEINLNTNEINNNFTGTWQKLTYEDKEILYLGNLEGYEDNVAFTLNENNIISKAKFIKSEDYTSQFILGSQFKEDVYSTLSTNPMIKLELNDTWSYISLPSSTVLCDNSIQSNLESICNQNYSLNDIFGNENIVYMLKHDGTDWTYWDNKQEVQVQYGYNKFSAINQKDGLLVKISSPITLSLPFSEETLVEDSFMRLYNKGWYLTSISGNKTVQEIEQIIETNNPNKRLSSILLFRNNQWEVYSPDENDYIDDTITRINSKIKSSESFWINIEDK